jgi:hypothetical protein
MELESWPQGSAEVKRCVIIGAGPAGLCRLWSGCILCEAEQSYNEIGALFRASSGPFFANFGA